MGPGFAAIVLLTANLAFGDVAPPVSIRMPKDKAQAVKGQEYAGEFLIHIHKPGTLTDFQFLGDGWTIVSFVPPATPLKAAPGIIRIPFRAVPSDPDKPIGLTFKFDGRSARQHHRVGPVAFSKKGKTRLLTSAPGAAGPQLPVAQPDPEGAEPRGGTVVVSGRIVYHRTGVDRTFPPDGDFVDPEDTPPMTVGADEISIAILDVDPVNDETMWTGTTNEWGFFTTPPLDADVDGDGSGPDLMLPVGCYREDMGEIFDPDADDFYAWYSDEIEDFEGGSFDFGIQFPLDESEHPAIHLNNSLVRARRFIIERHGYQTRFVSIHWPQDDWSAYFPSDEEIHIFDEHKWGEHVVVHEYGHHFVYGLYEPPPSNYNNGLCDEGTPEGDCFPNGGTWSSGVGHCIWCQENASDAWNEGWPDWFSEVVTRSLPARYTFEPGGAAYQALFSYDFESLNICCVDGMSHDATITEGFVAALLRDIEDASQDDEDGDDVRDLACLGPEEILAVLINQHPTTVLQFLSAFRGQYPQHTPELWSTAFNIAGNVYVSGFPADSQPPGVATGESSPSHPIGVGGALPCIVVEFNAAPDDATGASVYSLITTPNAAGQNPGTTPWPIIEGTDTCRIRAIVPVLDLGTYYVSVRARDNAGNWSPNWAKFGPFVVIDCNGSGILDVCDISCLSEGTPGCQIGGLCLGTPGCGSSFDCNQNFAPDECDIASGQSDDCNENGVPDECETATLKHWTGDDGMHPTWWHLGSNWAEEATPAAGNDVCIASGEVTPFLRQTNPTLGILTCHTDLDLLPGAGLGGVVLTLQKPSFIDGDLNMTTQNPVLQVDDSLEIRGTLNWSTGAIRGAGETTVTGAHTISGPVSLQFHTLNLQCDTLVTAGGIAGGGATNFVIHNFPGSTYTQAEGIVHQGNSSLFINEGTVLKPSGSGITRLDSAVNNSGEIRAVAGSLRFGSGLVNSGSIIGLPGTTLEFNGSQDLLTGSSVVGDLILFNASAPPNSRHVRGTYDAGAGTTIQTGANVTFHAGAPVVDYGNQLVVASSSVAHFEAVVGATVNFQSIAVTGTAHFDSADPIVTQTLSVGPGSVRGVNKNMTVNGLLSWNNGGSFLDNGVIIANGGISIAPGGTVKSLQSDLRNGGVANVQGAFEVSGNGQLHNLSTGLWDVQVDGTLISGSTLLFDNAGTLMKSAGAGTATIGTGSPAFRPTFLNSATIEARSGTLAFAWGTFTQSGGQIVLNGGNVSITGSPAMPMQLNGGVLKGNGTVTAVVNNAGAAVEPGLSAGALAITGAYNQTAGGALRIEIGGTSAGQFDTLSVGGAATLAGELNVQTIGGFGASPGQSFVILTASSITGTFASLTGTPGFAVSYAPTQVTLTVTNVTSLGDMNCDTFVDGFDIEPFVIALLNPAQYELVYTDCEIENGDVDSSGVVDSLDITPFVDCALNGGCP